jgi:hypothetical protein
MASGNELATRIPHLLLLSINQWWVAVVSDERNVPAGGCDLLLSTPDVRVLDCTFFFTNDLAFVVWAYLYNLSIFCNLDNLAEGV